jgi:acetyl esterase/lipase
MRTRIYLIAGVILLSTGLRLQAQSADDERRLKQFREQVNKPVVYHIDGEELVKIDSNISYERNTYDGKMDIYQPMDSTHKKPFVLIVHGKTPITTNPKNWGAYISWGKLLAAEGFVTATFTHGLAIPGTAIDDAGNDVVNALKFAKTYASKYQIDTNRIVVMAFSAGAPLLCRVLDEKGLKGLVVFYGFMNAGNASTYSGESKKTLDKYSLINYADSSLHFPPIFIGRAGLDFNVGLNKTIDDFAQKAANQNLAFTIVNHPTGVHGFDNQNDDARTKEIIGQMILFLKSHTEW